MQRFLRLVLVLMLSIWVMGWQAQAVGGIIKVETKTTVKITGDLLEIIITAKNNGTSPAHNVQINLTVLGENLKAPVEPIIKPGDAKTATFKKTIGGIKQGRYPLTVRIDFYDANQYPFSAVSGMTFHYKEDVNADLITLGKNLAMEKKGLITYDIKNLGDQPKNIRVNLVLPKELFVQEATTDIIVDARSEKTLTFPISNFSALEGAEYPVFSYFEFDVEDTHYTNVVRTQVNIVKKENLFRKLRWLWIVLTIVLSGVFIAMVIKSRKKTNKSK